jgi:hypothetical protein
MAHEQHRTGGGGQEHRETRNQPLWRMLTSCWGDLPYRMHDGFDEMQVVVT